MQRFLLCEEIRGECWVLLGTRLYGFDPGSHQSPREHWSVQSSQPGEPNSIDFSEQTNPLSVSKSCGLYASLCSCCVSFEAWLEPGTWCSQQLGNVGTGFSAPWGGGCLCLAWSSPEVSRREGEHSQRLQCNALAPG